MDRVLRGYSTTAPREYAEFTVCREMGWDFNQLDEQPAWRIEQLFLFLEREAVYRKTQEPK